MTDKDASTAGDALNRRGFLALCATAGSTIGAGCIGSREERDVATSPIKEGPTIGLKRIATGLTQPIALQTFRDDDRGLIADKLGVIHTYDSDGLGEKPFLDLRDEIATSHQEQGLLGLELHPEFPDTRRLYVRYSSPPRDGTPDDYSHTFVLSEFRATSDLSQARSETERTLLELPQPYPTHNSGAIVFGSDEYLYVGVGDGGSVYDKGLGHATDWYPWTIGGNGQDVTQNLLGSILRIDVETRKHDKPYGIPDDNPLVGREGLDEHYAWGFRNPWRMSFDGERLFVADVGQYYYEEINIVKKGGNYGWNIKEGRSCVDNVSVQEAFNENPLQLLEPVYLGDLVSELFFGRDCPDETPQGKRLIDPIIAYPHRKDGHPIGQAVVGGHVYRGSNIAELKNQYVFGDFIAGESGAVFAASPPENESGLWPIRQLEVAGAADGKLGRALLSIDRDEAGELHLLTTRFSEGTGAVHRMTSPH